MKVHKITVMVVDFDELGEEEVKSVIENTRYPNHCIYPDVKSIETKEVEWSDEHPLNSIIKSDDAFKELFSS